MVRKNVKISFNTRFWWKCVLGGARTRDVSFNTVGHCGAFRILSTLCKYFKIQVRCSGLLYVDGIREVDLYLDWHSAYSKMAVTHSGCRILKIFNLTTVVYLIKITNTFFNVCIQYNLINYYHCSVDFKNEA